MKERQGTKSESRPRRKNRVSRKVNEQRLNIFFDNLTSELNRYSTSDDTKSFAVQRQLMRMRKRAEFEKPELHEQAIVDFKEVNELVGNTTLSLSEEVIGDMHEFISYCLTRRFRRYDKTVGQGCFSLVKIFDQYRFGPGASNGVEGTGTVEKIDKNMTATVHAEPFVKLLRRSNTYYGAHDCPSSNWGITSVEGSRLTTVLKNETSVRTIAIEGSGNMALQLGAGREIEEALRCIGLDITDRQPINQAMARLGSLTGLICTIDLKKASDMILIELIRRTWPEQWFNFMMKIRSEFTTLPKGEQIKLNMMSTMGNGFTFPMMTLTIVALIYAMRRQHGAPPVHIRKWRMDWSSTSVFGDDIIIPTYEYAELTQLLNDAGFIVNHDKSYASGFFRESCGGDYYKGYNVTPFYVKTLTRPADIYVAINQLLRWAARHIVSVVHTLRYLVSLLPDGEVFFVPEWLEDTSGIKTAQFSDFAGIVFTYSYLRSKPKRRKYRGCYAMPLIAGGYLSSGKDGVLLYHPRVDWVGYKTGKAKLPDGYLDGWDPRYGTLRESGHISLMVSMIV